MSSPENDPRPGPGPSELDPEGRAAFLGNGGTGVLSFDTPGDTPPHSLPVSYGFDVTEETFYFRLSVGPEQQKTDYLDAPVSFVVFGQDEADGDGPWRSVVARGRLEPIDDQTVGTEALAGLDRSHIPMFDVFARPTQSVSFEFFRLVPEELTGYEEGIVTE